MCLNGIITGKKKKTFIDNITKDGIKVYKIVGVEENKYYPPMKKTSQAYEDGLNILKDENMISINGWNIYYKAGFHFYTRKIDAQERLKKLKELLKIDPDIRFIMESRGKDFRQRYVIIECIVKKSWINAYGYDDFFQKRPTIVAKKAIFPPFNNRHKVKG